MEYFRILELARPAWATAHGFNLNALAYSAVQKRDANVTKMYLDAGANPMARTSSGDSVALLGVANGMLDLFGRQEFLDTRSEETGETGLFDLAREIDIDVLRVAYRMGADPEIKNIRGQTVLDLLDPPYQAEVLAVIAEAQSW
jgi:ankyrin repeat protein